MLRSRIIPALLIRDGGLTKTVQFQNGKYVGDPLNAVRIFNEKEADEIIVLDIDATTKQREPDYNMIASLAAECRMPLCYGGGVNTLEQIIRILGLGVEKIALGNSAITNADLISNSSQLVGKQSIVAVLDIKKKKLSRSYRCHTHNGTIDTGLDPIGLARNFETLGAGELLINSIDNDGMMKGYDRKIISTIKDNVNIPVTALGGAGTIDCIRSLVKEGPIGAAAGSFFVFKGKYKAVLISYPKKSTSLQV